MGQNPKFVKGNIFGAPLIMHYRYFRNSRRKRMYFTTIIEEQRDPRIHDLGPFLAKIRKFQAKLGNFIKKIRRFSAKFWKFKPKLGNLSQN